MSMKIVAVDPGESLGYAIGTPEWETAGTSELWDFIHALGRALGVTKAEVADQELLDRLQGVEFVVIEDWQLYPWELENLGWDKCRTARGIGALEYICQSASVPYTLQPAAIKDTAVSAGAEENFLRPLHENRHANDATMHLTYYLLQQRVGRAKSSS